MKASLPPQRAEDFKEFEKKHNLKTSAAGSKKRKKNGQTEEKIEKIGAMTLSDDVSADEDEVADVTSDDVASMRNESSSNEFESPKKRRVV